MFDVGKIKKKIGGLIQKGFDSVTTNTKKTIIISIALLGISAILHLTVKSNMFWIYPFVTFLWIAVINEHIILSEVEDDENIYEL